jgi:hypothetical protein
LTCVILFCVWFSYIGYITILPVVSLRTLVFEVETTFRFLLVGWSLADVDWPASAPSCSSSFVLRRYVGISFINKGKYSFMVDLLINFCYLFLFWCL